MLPRIALTAGEPAGIGPDVILGLAEQFEQYAEIVVIGDPQLIQRRASLLGKEIHFTDFNPQLERPSTRQSFSLLALPTMLNVTPGQLNIDNVPYVLNTLKTAVTVCQQQYCQALCTTPIHKGIINQSGLSFSGHTEFFAQQAGVDKVLMMLETRYPKANNHFRVALVTTHLPLKDISQQITVSNVQQSIEILYRHLVNHCGIEQPQIIVAGLNPHAGEGGYLGREEIDVISPVIKNLQARSWDIQGPLPADTMFSPEFILRADAFLAMFHDQGLPVLKCVGFHRAANITLGLPFIRTSVDHGTALDLAGSGKANPSSLQTAIDSAIHMITKKFS